MDLPWPVRGVGPDHGLNEVRSWRPEQSDRDPVVVAKWGVSMKSGLGDRNNVCGCVGTEVDHMSQ